MKLSINSMIESLSNLHRLLVLTSLGLIVALLLTTAPDTLTNARRDILAIQHMNANWNPSFLERLYLDQFTDRDTFYNKWRIKLKHEYLIGLLQNTGPGPIEITMEYPMDIFVGWNYSEDGQHIEEPAPNTVAEFATLWEKSTNVQVTKVYGLYHYAYVQTWKDKPVVERIEFDIIDEKDEYASGSGKVVQSNFVFDPGDLDPTDRDILGITFANSNKLLINWYIWIPVATDTEDAFWNPASPYVVTEYLVNAMGIPKRQGPFEESFSDLNLATKDLQNIPFDNLLILLEQKRAEKGSGFEFLGVKLPIAQINMFGTVLLTALIALFYIYLSNLCKALPEEPVDISSIWIGVFSDKLSKLFSVVSSVIFPASTVIVLSLKAIYDQYLWTSNYSFALIAFTMIIPPLTSIVFCVGIYNEFVKIWKYVSPQSEKTERAHNLSGLVNKNKKKKI